MKRLLAAVSALALTTLLHAQDWAQVNELYSAGLYSEVIRLVGNADSDTAEGFRTLCALRMRLPGAFDRAESFLKNSHEHILAPQVCYRMALDLFDAGQYSEALRRFNSISREDLPKSQLPEYLYKLGYCAFGEDDWDRAKDVLLRMQDLPYSDYTAPSYYSLGYMAYARKNFPEAADWFHKAAHDHRFSALANYYILECRFNEKDYNYVIRHGEDLYDKVPADRRPHMARIMSESYLVLGDVEKARTYYRKNLEGRGPWSRSDYFYSGEINYVTQDWQAAVDNFTRMEDRTDSLGQVANYQLGHSYIRLRNKVAAMDAFKDASAAAFNPEIQEDALLNYGKLAFDLGRDTAPFEEYIRRYGRDEKGDEIYSYMAMASLQNHDYKAAVEAYDQIDQLDPAMRANYSKAHLLHAYDLMQNGSWRAAVPLLKAAAYYSPRREGFNQLARYYQAEALYRDGKWADARSILTDLYNLQALSSRPEGERISYQLGYTYFKEGNYAQALKWFDNYLEQDNPSLASDTQLRVADCYFFQGNYSTAVAAYERQMSRHPDAANLYPGYRAGIASGLLGDDTRKVHFLEGAKNALPETPYYGESLYELGRAYVALKNDEDAVRTFRKLRSSTQDPDLGARALLELGMIARNAGRSSEALDCYKEVVAEGGAHAEDALLAIEAIYRTREDPDAYLAYVNSLGGAARRTEAQKEEVYFSAAEQLYLSGDYSKAQATLLAYLEKYPQAAFGSKARFYLAECYRFGGAREQAADLYLAALKQGLDGSLTESATAQYARLSYELGDYPTAYSAYTELRSVARLEANLEAAILGQMRSAFRARRWEDAIAGATSVIGSDDAALQREARYIRAKSYLSSSRRSEALEDFRVLTASPSTPEGAEAVYTLIQDQYDRGDFTGIQEKVYDFSAKAGGQNYWLAKAFIVLGDTFAEQGNLAQARATFESLRSGYVPSGSQDDVPDQVELRLSKLKN